MKPLTTFVVLKHAGNIYFGKNAIKVFKKHRIKRFLPDEIPDEFYDEELAKSFATLPNNVGFDYDERMLFAEEFVNEPIPDDYVDPVLVVRTTKGTYQCSFRQCVTMFQRVTNGFDFTVEDVERFVRTQIKKLSGGDLL